MARKKHTAEQIIAKLREAEVALASGKAVGEVCRGLAITEQTYYRWRKEYGGLKLDQARRLKELERENGRLPRSRSFGPHDSTACHASAISARLPRLHG